MSAAYSSLLAPSVLAAWMHESPDTHIYARHTFSDSLPEQANASTSYIAYASERMRLASAAWAAGPWEPSRSGS